MKAVLCGLLPLLLALPLRAQGLSTRVAQVETAAFPEIGVVVSVFGADGKPVPGLTRDAFTLEEDGKPVTGFSVSVEKAPLSVALVLDCSGSMQPAIGN